MANWADIVARGSGAVEFRLVIEGCAFEFCTSPYMTGACTESGHDGKRRVAGLVRDGLGFEESAYLAGAELDVRIPPFRIVETGYPDLDAASSVFSAIPTVIGALDTSLAFGATSAVVFNDAAFAIDGYYHVGREVVKVTAKPGASTLTIVRGKWGTTAATHNTVSSGGDSHQERPIRDQIQIWKHRRLWLYAHTIDELAVASLGTLVMRGVLSTEPELADEATWQLGVESRYTLLEQEVAAGADVPKFPRGIYYPAGHPLSLSVLRSDTANAGETSSDPKIVQIAGFFETNERFAQAVVDALTASIDPTWDLTWSYRIMPDGRWELAVKTDSADQRYIEVGGGSPVDGWFTYRLSPIDWAGGGREPDVARLSTIAASTWYFCTWTATAYASDPGQALPEDAVRKTPRTINFQTSATASEIVASLPLGRQYLDDVGTLIVGDRVVITPAEAAEGGAPTVLLVTAVDTTAGYIDCYVSMGGSLEGPSGARGAGWFLPSFTAVRSYGDVDGATVADFRDGLVDQAPLYGNDGSVPWITDDDLADWATPVFLAAQRVWQQRRIYSFYRGERLDEVLREEFRLLGLFPYLDADFKIQLRALTIPTDPVADLIEITGPTHLTDEGFGRIRSGADGAVNRVEISRGYNPRSDKYELGPVIIQDVAGISDAGGFKAVLEIKPKTRAATGEITPAEAEYFSQPARVLFSGKLVHVEVDVPMTLWDVLVGDSVLLTVPQLPMAGKRAVHDPNLGMTQRRAIVVGRRWSLDEPAGTLTCLIVGLNVAGYAPTGRIASAAGAGTAWTVTLEANHYAPTGGVDASFFVVGDRVWLVPWDAPGTGVKDDATITAIVGNAVSVTFGAAWAGLGAVTWNLVLDASDEVPATRLAGTAFVAAEDRTLQDVNLASRTAFVFAP